MAKVRIGAEFDRSSITSMLNDIKNALNDGLKDLSVSIKEIDLGTTADKFAKSLNDAMSKIDFGKTLNFGDALTGTNSALAELTEQIKGVKDVIDQLNNSFSSIGKQGADGIETIIANMKELNSLVQQINSKNFSITNMLTYQEAKSSNNGIALYRDQARELVKALDELSAAMGRMDTNAFGKVYMSMKEQFAELDNMDTAALMKRVNSKTVDGLQSMIDEANRYRSIMEGIITSSAQFGANISMPDMSAFETATEKVVEFERNAERLKENFIATAEAASQMTTATTSAGEADQKVSVSAEEAQKSLEKIKTVCDEIGVAFESLQKKINAAFDFSQPIASINELKSQVESLGESLDTMTKKVERANRARISADERNQQKANKAVIASQAAALKTIYGGADKAYGTGELKAEFDEVVALYREYVAAVSATKGRSGIATDEDLEKITALRDRIVGLIGALHNKAEAHKEDVNAQKEDAKAADELEKRIKTISTKIRKALNGDENLAQSSFGGRLKDMLDQLSRGDVDTAALDKMEAQVKKLISGFREADGTSGGFFTTIRNGIRNIAGFTMMVTAIRKVIQYLKKMTSAIKEVDTAMTELKKVTNLTQQGYNEFYKDAVNTAREVGATVSDTINAAADFARLGYNTGDALRLAEAALVYKNVGDGIEDVAQATESMISTVKAFGYEASDAMMIVDEFNEVGNKFAISSVGIGEALVRSAAALHGAGNSLEESIGLVTAANAVIQNPVNVGTSLKTLTMFLRAAKPELEAMGEDAEDCANSVAELQEKLLALTGVDIMLDANTFKSTYQIIKEIAEVWDKIPDIDQAAVTKLIGGKRNANTIQALLTNFKDAESVVEVATNAMGSAYRENEEYMDSVAGRLEILKGKFQEFSEALIGGQTVKFFLTLASAVADFGIAIGKIPGWITASLATLVTLSLSLRQLTEAFDKVKMAVKGIELAKIIGTMTNPFVALTTVAVGATVGIFSYIEHTKRMREEAIDAVNDITQSYQDARTSFNQNIDTLEKLRGRFDSLSKKVNKTEAEYEEYKDIVQQIIDISPGIVQQYDDQGNAVLNYATALDEAIEKQRELYDLQKQEYISKGEEIFNVKSEDYKKQAKAIEDGARGFIDSIDAAMGEQKLSTEQYKEFYKDLVKATGGRAVKEKDSMYNARYYENVIKMFENRKALESFLASAYDNYGVLFEPNEIEAIMSDLRGIVARPLSDMRNDVKAFVDWEIAYSSDAWSEYYQSIPDEALSAYYAGAEGIVDLYSHTYEKNLDDARKYTQEFATLFNAITTHHEPVTSLAEAADTMDLKEYVGQVEALVGSLKEQYGDIAPEGVLDAVGAWLLSLKDGALEASLGMDSLTKATGSFGDALSNLQSGYDLLNKALGEMSSGGGLSVDTIGSIAKALAEGEKLSDFIYAENGVLKLNTEAWEARSRAIAESNIIDIQSKIDSTKAAMQGLWGYEYGSTEEAEYLKLREQLEGYVAELQIYKAVLDQFDQEAYSFDISGVFGDLDSAKNEATALAEALAKLGQSGAEAFSASEWRDIVNQYSELAKVDGIFDIDTVEGQTAALEGEFQRQADAYTQIVDQAINTIRDLYLKAQEAGDEEAAGTLMTIQKNLIALRNGDFRNLFADIFKVDKQDVATFDDIASNLQSGYDLLNQAKQEMADDGSISTGIVQSIAKALDDTEKLSDYIYVENGALKLNAEAWEARSRAMAEAKIGDLDAQISALEESRIRWVKGDDGKLKKVNATTKETEEQLEALRKEREIYAAMLAEYDQAETKFSLEDMFGDISKVKSDASEITDALSQLNNDVAMSADEWRELVSKYQEMMSIDGILDLNTAGAQRQALVDQLQKYETDYQNIIHNAMSALQEERNRLADAGENTRELDILIANLKSLSGVKLEDIIDVDGTAKIEEAINNITDAMSKARSAQEVLSDIASGEKSDLEIFKEIMSLAKDAEVDFSTFIESIDEAGVHYNEGAINEAAEGFLKTIQEMEDADPEHLSGLTDAVREMLHVTDDADEFGDAMSNVSKAISLLRDVTGNGVSLDTINTLREMFGEDWEGYLLTDQAGKYIGVNTEKLNEYVEAQIEAGQLTEATAAIIRDSMKKAGEGVEDTTDKFKALTDAISELQSVQSLLDSLQMTGGKGSLDTLGQIIDIASKTGKPLGEYLTIDKGTIAYNQTALEAYQKSLFSYENLKNVPGMTEAMAAALQDYALSQIKATEETQKFNDALSATSKAKGFIQDIRSGEGDFISMLQTAREMAEQTGQSLDEFYTMVNGEAVWNEDAAIEWAYKMIDGLEGVADVTPETIAALKALATAEIEATTAAERMDNMMSSAKTVIDGMASANTYTQVTLDQYRSLIEISTDYANVLEFNNGLITINKEKYDEVTNSILQNTLAEAEAQKWAILLSDEYLDLLSNVDHLDDKQQARLDSLNAEAASYDVLAGEIRNATSAYQQFLNADSSGTSEQYGAGQKAWKMIQDVLYNKNSGVYQQKGNEGYQKAMSFLVRPDIDFADAEKSLKRYFSDAYEGSMNFVNDLYENGFADKNTHELNASVDDIADKFGLTTEAVYAMLEQLNLYLEEPVTFTAGEEAQKTADELGDKLTSLSEEVQHFQDNDVVDLDTEAAQESITQFEGRLAETKQALQDLSPAIDPTPYLQSIAEIEGRIAQLKKGVTETDDSQLNIDTSAAESALSRVEQLIQGVADKVKGVLKNPLKINTAPAVSALGTVSSKLSAIITQLNNLAARGAINVDVNINKKTTVTTTNGSKGTAKASGSFGAPGGRTLVGELGTEIVVDPATNRWYTVGEHGAEFVDMPRGAIVFNADQTRKLLAAGRVGDRGYALLAGNAAAYTVDERNAHAVLPAPTSTKSAKPKKKKKSSSSSSSKSSSSLDSLLEKYKEAQEYLDHLIEHQQYLFDMAEHGLDYTGMNASLVEQANLYRQIIEKTTEAIEEMKKAGAQDTDKQLQEMEQSLWSANRSLLETLDKINTMYLDALNEKIDAIQSAYDSLTKAAEEYSETGEMTMDTFQSLIGNGVQYLGYLKKVKGQYVVNTEALEELAKAEKEQLKVEAALSYLNSIKDALSNGEINKVYELADASATLADNTWRAVDSLLNELFPLLHEAGLDDLFDSISANVRTLKEIGSDTVLAAARTLEDELGDLRDGYEEVDDYYKHLIEHQEQLYDRAEKGMNYDGMIRSLKEQEKIYRKQITEIEKTMGDMIAAGAKDTDEQFQEMEKSLWDANKALSETLNKISTLYVDILNDKIDDMQSAYSQLNDMASEYAKTGHISMDTYQALLSQGLQFLDYLKLENGQYVVNTEALEKMMAAEKEQLAIRTALSYLDDITFAIEDGDIQKINNLVNATEHITRNTWAVVEYQLEILRTSGLTSKQYETIVANINKLKDITKTVVVNNETTSDAMNDQASAMNKIIDLTEDLIKKEVNDQIDALNEQVDLFNEIIKLKKESLKASKEENDYQKDVTAKLKDINDLQVRIDKLALDSSRSAQAERMSLLEELREKQEDLADYQADHSYDAQVEALDKMSEEYKKSKDDEIEALKDTISSEEKIYQLAIQRIRSDWNHLYDDLIKWNTEQGNILNSEITDNWDRALEAAKKYGNFVKAMKGVLGEVEQSGGTDDTLKHRVDELDGTTITALGEYVVEGISKFRSASAEYTPIDFVKTLSDKLGTAIKNVFKPTSLTNLTAMTPALAGASMRQNIDFSPTIDVSINHNGSFNNSDAESFGQTIATTALDKLYEAFEKRGMTGIYGGILKNA